MMPMISWKDNFNDFMEGGFSSFHGRRILIISWKEDVNHFMEGGF
jgi:hypothetical protein